MSRLSVILSLAWVCSVLGSCANSENARMPGEGEAETPRVTRQDFQERLVLSGHLVAKTSTSIRCPQADGALAIQWMAKSGTFVKKGDKVLEMDTSAITGDIESLKSSLLEAENSVAKALDEAQVTLAEKQHLLRQAKLALKRATLDANVPASAYPARTYADMQLALGRAKAAKTSAIEAVALERKVAHNTVAQRQIDLERSRRGVQELLSKLKTYILYAPTDGLLIAGHNWRGNRPYRTGDKAWPGSAVLMIPDLSVMTVEAKLSDVDDGRAEVGMQVRSTLTAFPGEPRPGHIVSLSPVAQVAEYQSLRQVFDVVIKLDATDKKMRPGMTARVEILGPKQQGVLVAPRSSLRFAGGPSPEVVLPNGERVAVILGPCNADRCVVRSGVTEGQALGRGDTRP